MAKYLSAFFISLLSVSIIVAVGYLLGITSFSFAWALHFMLMLSVSSLMQAFEPKLTAAYFDGKNWERNGKVYSWLGVNIFRKLLVWIGWERLHKAAHPVKKDLQALRQLEHKTRQSEYGHLIIFFIVMAFSAWVAYHEGIAQSRWLIVLNLILNVYPILVQRYNRPRLLKAIQVYTKLSARSAKGKTMQ